MMMMKTGSILFCVKLGVLSLLSVDLHLISASLCSLSRLFPRPQSNLFVYSSVSCFPLSPLRTCPNHHYISFSRLISIHHLFGPLENANQFARVL